MRTADRSQQARKLLDIFRSCNPDEFGLINVASFHRRFGKLFDLTAAQSARLFHIGDPDNLQELDYARFRNCFVPIDTDKDALRCATFRPSMRLGNPFSNDGDGGGGKGGQAHVSEHSIVQGMPRDKRARYLMHKRVQVVLEQQAAALELCFRCREDTTISKTAPRSIHSSSIFPSPNPPPAYSPPRQTMVRTKLTFPQLEAALRKCGMNMAGVTSGILQEMYGGDTSREETTLHGASSHPYRYLEEVPRIGFSELIKASDLYFALLGQSESELAERVKYGKMHDMYGRRLGRRAVGTGPAAGGHLSQPGFLAHDDGRLGISSPDAMDAHMRNSANMRGSASVGDLSRLGGSGRQTLHNIENSSHGGMSYRQQGGGMMHPSPSVGAIPLASPALSASSSAVAAAWGGPVAGVSSKPNAHNPVDFGLTASGAPPRYDQAFANDPKKHLWESRWLDKKLPDQKRHLAQKALNGANDLARRQDHNMAMRLSFDASYGSQRQRDKATEMQQTQPREVGLGRYWG
jgi:hypothetical protein